MPTLRRATVADAETITEHRHQMFADNKLASEQRFREMDANFLPWVRERLADGRYVGLLLEDEKTGQVVAGAGIFYMDFPPHFLDPQPCRAYLLNFYTSPEDRGNGYANVLLTAAVADCRERGVEVVTLHASRFGKPIYEKFGFKHHNEWALRPDGEQIKH
ncbi:GNAT family N-acetyltransferase [Granulicella paludicola]|jgi:ribosomal protein S18 acetylase RimI-like enzyme|uniref:GNAT family N-acetyltransferase n=1 Tax=Granulicella paludicola TaxID=474951 RepID=UPI0021E0C3A9|nr:GNAT family N-acetyltransferase [Granulicella paludicola]